MKMILVLIAAVAAVAARADLVLQQQITTPNYNGVTTMKIKGAKLRMDLYAGQPQAQSIITDLNTGEIITLMHGQKLYVKLPGAAAKSGSAGAASRAPVARPTGQTQKFGSYDTELYTWSNNRGINGTAWVVRNFPDFARIQSDLAVLDRSSAADNDTTPELSKLPGMVVRSQVAGGGQTMTLALISAKETALDASQFGIPRDYKEVPRLKPVKVTTTQSQPSTTTGGNRPAAASRPVAHSPASGNVSQSGGSKTPSSSKTPDNSKASPGNFSTQKAPEW